MDGGRGMGTLTLLFVRVMCTGVRGVGIAHAITLHTVKTKIPKYVHGKNSISNNDGKKQHEQLHKQAKSKS
jgi:hypothetical protein